MQDKQPDAIRLADALMYYNEYDLDITHSGLEEQAATLLRTQHVAIEQLTHARADLEAENAELKRKLAEASNTLCIGGQMISAIAHALENTKLKPS